MMNSKQTQCNRPIYILNRPTYKKMGISVKPLILKFEATYKVQQFWIGVNTDDYKQNSCTVQDTFIEKVIHILRTVSGLENLNYEVSAIYCWV